MSKGKINLIFKEQDRAQENKCGNFRNGKKKINFNLFVVLHKSQLKLLPHKKPNKSILKS